jgi:hypothetical protein
VPVPGLPIGNPLAAWPTPLFRSACPALGDVAFAVGGWAFGLFSEELLWLAPVVVPCVPIPDGADGPELALLDEVPVPAPELAAAPALPPPAPPPPPPACAKAGEDRAIHASATMADFLVMDDLPSVEGAIRDRSRKFLLPVGASTDVESRLIRIGADGAWDSSGTLTTSDVHYFLGLFTSQPFTALIVLTRRGRRPPICGVG